MTQNCDNSNLPVHLGTWIAECTVHKAIGKYIKMFKDKGVRALLSWIVLN